MKVRILPSQPTERKLMGKNFVMTMILILLGVVFFLVHSNRTARHELLSTYGDGGVAKCYAYSGCIWIGPDGTVKRLR
mgnify:CR=1 FL=1